MAPISLDQLFIIIEKQDKRISALQSELERLKAWSDLNDHYLEEMIEANGAAVDRLQTVINEMHEADVINERIEELKAEDEMPVAQLLLEFIEENASDEQAEQAAILYPEYDETKTYKKAIVTLEAGNTIEIQEV